MKKRVLMALVVSLMIFAAFYASAANLDVEGGTLQAGVDADLVCDPDGVFVDGWGYETVDQSVFFVRIGDVDGACEGEDLVVGLHDGAGNDLGSELVSVPSGGGLVTVSFPGGVSANLIEQISVAITS